MKQFYMFLVAAILFPAILSAQNTYKPGYVVTTQGDTLRGSLDYKEMNQTQQKVHFKDNSGKATDYDINNSKAFGFPGLERFEAYTLPLSTDEIDPSKLGYKYDSTQLVANVFLKVITKGKYLALFSYTDDIKTHFIVLEKKSKQPVELSHHLFMNDNNVVVNVNRYRIQLSTYAESYGQKGEAMASLMQRADYNSDDLARVVNTINGEAGKKMESSQKSSARFFVGAAINGTRLDYKGYIDLVANSQNHINYYPQINLGIDYYQNAEVARLLLRGELSFSNTTIKSISPDAEHDIDMFTVTLQPQIIYNLFNTKPLKVFIGTGILLHYSSIGKNVFTVTNRHFTPSTGNPPVFTNVWYGLPVKAGIMLNGKIELYGAYNLPSTIVNVTQATQDYTGTLTSFQAGINYFFGGKK